jgi:hypothetical protein
MRRRFSLGNRPGQMPYTSFEQCRNAMRAEQINVALDEGKRVFGDDGPDAEGTWYEIDEAVEPHGNGITARTKCGKYVKIYSYDTTDARAAKFDASHQGTPL